MPSISNSKVEKQPSLDIQEPQSKVQLLIENKIRNLEKRKSRLEQLEEERKSGKELNQDQRKAIKKYEEVVEMLEFFKEFKKSVQAIFSEYNRALKEKTAKENKLRHHKELERLRTIILFQDVLNSVTQDTVRNDFLNGTNGAIQLAPEKLNHLEELNKVVHLDRTRTDVALTKQINQVAERYMSLVEGKKTPEVIKGVTYEEIKETLTVINDCGYLDSKTKKTNSNSSSVAPSAAIKPTPAPVSSAPSQHSVERQEGTTSVTSSYETTKHQHHSQQSTQQQPNAISSDIHTSRSNDMNTQSVGVKQYTQKSRLEGAPHMDPAVLAMGPVPSYPPTFGNKQAVEALAAQLSGIPMSSASMSSKGVIYETTGGHQPIPSQTFTNQRFAAMMTGGTYVQPVHPSMLPASSFSIQNPGIAMSAQNTMSSHHNAADHQHLHQQQMGMIDPNSVGSNQGQPMMGGGLASQNIGGYESEATFTQFQAPIDTNRGNQAASRDKQNFHDDGSGFGSHYGQYRRNPRGGGGNRGPGNQGGPRSGNRSYQPMNGYSSRSSNRGGGGQGQGGMVRSNRPKQGVPQDTRNMANSATWLGQ